MKRKKEKRKEGVKKRNISQMRRSSKKWIM